MFLHRALRALASIVLIVALCGLTAYPYDVARGAVWNLNYGGIVAYVDYFCTASPGYMAWIFRDGITFPIFFIYGFSAIKSYGPPLFEGQQILGEAIGYFPCFFFCGPYICVRPGGPIGLPNGGTSLL